MKLNYMLGVMFTYQQMWFKSSLFLALCSLRLLCGDSDAGDLSERDQSVKWELGGLHVGDECCEPYSVIALCSAFV